ncbi:MAG TPA: hypothetical protein VFQ37_03720 [Mycobacterium sp.]|nr:hypothetical protein [Mycobacterium sp.]
MTEHHDLGSGEIPAGTAAHIIRRAPTRPMPVTSGDPGLSGRMPRGAGMGPTEAAALPEANAALPIAACAVAIISGWATSVVATDLIASWWRTDRLFCVAAGFLTLVFAATTVSGVILLLRRQWLGRHLIAIGAVVALLTFGSLFVAGARVPWIVHTIPVVQVASALLALHPATKRWLLAACARAW